MKDKFIFSIDIDNTLFNSGIVCRKNRMAIAEARRRGHYVFINTARSMAAVPPKIQKIKLDGYIASLGSYITLNNNIIYNAQFGEGEIKYIFDYFNDRNSEVFVEGDKLIAINVDETHGCYINVKNGTEAEELLKGTSVSKVFIPEILSEDVCDEFRDKYSFFRHAGYSEFTVKGNNKGTALKILADYLNIPIENTVSFGDSLNDVEMLTASGIAVVMGDGADEPKAVADIITCKASDGGVAEGIMKIIDGQYKRRK